MAIFVHKHLRIRNISWFDVERQKHKKRDFPFLLVADRLGCMSLSAKSFYQYTLAFSVKALG